MSEGMIEFEIDGPFKIPHYTDGQKRIKYFDKWAQDDFWDDCEASSGIDISVRNGCYIFGVSTKRVFPWYVGKTTKGFGKEIFTPDKVAKISFFINQHGTPVIFFVYKKFKNKEGVKTLELIAELEDFLIQSAVYVNPELLNVRGTRRSKWSIRGSVRSSPQIGKPSAPVRKFKHMLGLQ
jgi:hypothetical protein